MSTPFTDFLSVPGWLTAALKEKETQTVLDWCPGKSPWLLGYESEPKPFFVNAARTYLEINEAREKLPTKQVPMPGAFKIHFALGDTMFGRGDENHRSIRVLADIAVAMAGADSEISMWSVELIQKIVTDYADDKNSCLSWGGVLGTNGKPTQYLGPTGRWRKFAMIVAMIHDVGRVYELPGWTIPKALTATALPTLLNMHLDYALDDDADMCDDPKPDHLPFDQYACLFQMGLAVAACKRAQQQPWPAHIRDKLAKIVSRCRSWISAGYKRDSSGAIIGCYYDVPRDWTKVDTVAGNVDFVLNGVPKKAHDGLGVALHLANIDIEFDAFLKKSKAKELAKWPAFAAKFGLA